MTPIATANAVSAARSLRAATLWRIRPTKVTQPLLSTQLTGA